MYGQQYSGGLIGTNPIDTTNSVRICNQEDKERKSQNKKINNKRLIEEKRALANDIAKAVCKEEFEKKMTQSRLNREEITLEAERALDLCKDLFRNAKINISGTPVMQFHLFDDKTEVLKALDMRIEPSSKTGIKIYDLLDSLIKDLFELLDCEEIMGRSKLSTSHMPFPNTKDLENRVRNIFQKTDINICALQKILRQYDKLPENLEDGELWGKLRMMQKDRMRLVIAKMLEKISENPFVISFPLLDVREFLKRYAFCYFSSNELNEEESLNLMRKLSKNEKIQKFENLSDMVESEIFAIEECMKLVEENIKRNISERLENNLKTQEE